jgi:hypothetical protein
VVVTWKEAKGGPRVVNPFSTFRRLGVGGTRSLRELACRSSETLKCERCVGSEKRRALKDERVHRFSQSLCQGIKGTCGFIQGVPAGVRRAISAQKKIDPETRRSQNPVEVGGLHQVVSEPGLRLYISGLKRLLQDTTTNRQSGGL